MVEYSFPETKKDKHFVEVRVQIHEDLWRCGFSKDEQTIQNRKVSLFHFSPFLFFTATFDYQILLFSIIGSHIEIFGYSFVNIDCSSYSAISRALYLSKVSTDIAWRWIIYMRNEIFPTFGSKFNISTQIYSENCGGLRKILPFSTFNFDMKNCFLFVIIYIP